MVFRIVQCHAIIDVVIDVRVMLCHQAMDNSGFSTFLNFPLRVQTLILLSCCINALSLFPVAILCTLLHRENTSFEVWYLQISFTFGFMSLQLFVFRFSCICNVFVLLFLICRFFFNFPAGPHKKKNVPVWKKESNTRHNKKLKLSVFTQNM